MIFENFPAYLSEEFPHLHKCDKILIQSNWTHVKEELKQK